MATNQKCTVTGYEYDVDQTTGEVKETRVNVSVPLGTLMYTPAQQAAYKQRKELEAEREARRKSGMSFSFVSSDTSYQDIRPATAARLIYLATFLGYSDVLMTTQRKPMTRDDLEGVLQISSAQTYRFWNEVKGKYINENADGYLMLSKDFFIRGRLPQGGSFQRVYSEAVRKLYRETSTARHKYLGYVFQLLPFVNLEYNIICSNPFEKDLEKIQPLTIDELCSRIGYSTKNRARLIDAYSTITFPVDNRQERLCVFVSTGGKQGETKAFINPRILYRGSDPDQVKLLAKFCEP